MEEAEFLAGYDPNSFSRPSVAIDLVLMGVADGAPVVLLRQRAEHPFAGQWALPGGFVGVHENLDEAARRVLGDKAGLGDALLEQLYTFGDVNRDPRMRIISVAYLALMPAERLIATQATSPELTIARLDPGAPMLTTLPLAFDHHAILTVAIERLRGKLDYSPVAFAWLPERFTLRELQAVHEAIRGERLNKPAFRRRMLDRGWLEPTGEREAGASFRPAELYRYRPLAEDQP